MLVSTYTVDLIARRPVSYPSSLLPRTTLCCPPNGHVDGRGDNLRRLRQPASRTSQVHRFVGQRTNYVLLSQEGRAFSNASRTAILLGSLLAIGRYC